MLKLQAFSIPIDALPQPYLGPAPAPPHPVPRHPRFLHSLRPRNPVRTQNLSIRHFHAQFHAAAANTGAAIPYLIIHIFVVVLLPVRHFNQYPASAPPQS